MESKNYIVNELERIKSIFPEISFKYKYIESELLYIIYVEPLEIYENDQNYMKEESDLLYNFENKFLTESIMFISENSLTKMEEPYHII
jgi:hypothetical protein